MRRVVSTVTLSIICALIAVLPQGTAQAASSWHERPATYGVHVDEDVPVTMSDGVVLSSSTMVQSAPRSMWSTNLPVRPR